MAANKLPPWLEWQFPKEKKKKKKPEKRFIGPTREAASQGLAGPGGKKNTNYPAKMPGVSRAQQMSGVWTPTETPETAATSITPVGSLIAQTQLSGEPAPMTMTPQETTTRNISLAYFNLTGILPDPHQVWVLMTNPATAGLTVKQYVNLLKGAEKVAAKAAKYESTQVGLFHGKRVTLDNPEYGQPGTRAPGEPDVLSARKGALPQVTHPTFTMVSPVTKDTIREEIRRLEAAGKKETNNPMDAAMTSDSKDEIRAFSDMLARRMRNRGDPVEWDTDEPWGDPDFLRAAAMYAMGPQWAYTLYGDDKEKKNAQGVIDYLRTLPFSKDDWDEMGRKTGASVADWSDEQTFGMVIDAMRHSDEDFIKQAVWDSWLYGRRKDTSPSQALYQYATKFGTDNLPLAQQAEFKEGEETVMGFLGDVTENGSEAWRKMSKVPVLAQAIWPIGYFGSRANKLLMNGVSTIFRSFSVLYDLLQTVEGGPNTVAETDKEKIATTLNIIGMVAPGGYSGLWFALSAQILSDEDAITDSGLTVAEAKQHINIAIDGETLARKWEEHEGRNPFTTYTEQWSKANYGHVKPWATDIGDLTNFGVEMGLAVKVGDPLVRTAIKYTGKGTFAAGRATERYIKDARLRYKAKRAERGEWMLRVSKEDVAKMPEPDQARFAELQKAAEKSKTPEIQIAEIEAEAAELLAEHGITGSNTPIVFDEWVGQSTATKTPAGAKAAKAVNEYRANPSAETFEAAREAAMKSAPRHAEAIKSLENPHTAEMPGQTAIVDGGVHAKRVRALDEAVLPHSRGTGGTRTILLHGDDAKLVEPDFVTKTRGGEHGPNTIRHHGRVTTLTEVADALESGRLTEAQANRLMQVVEQEVAGRLKAGGVRPETRQALTDWQAKAAAPEAAPYAVGESVETATDAQGVKVAPVRLKNGKTAMVDAGGQEIIQRFNDADMPTSQSHFGPEGHPAGHPTIKYGVKNYIEWKVGELTDSVRRKITYHAGKRGLDLEIVRSGKGVKPATIIVRGTTKELEALADRVAGPKKGAEGRPYVGGEPDPATQTPLRDDLGPVEGPQPPVGVSDPYSDLMNSWFVNQAEAIARHNDPTMSWFLNEMYQIPESNLAARAIIKELAIETDLNIIKSKMNILWREHGIDMDAGASAFFRNQRMNAYMSGFGKNNILRFFFTAIVRGKSFDVDGSTRNVHNHMTLAKLGLKSLDEVIEVVDKNGVKRRITGRERLRELTQMLDEEPSAVKKNNIVNDICTEMENNLIAREGSLDGLHKFEHFYYKSAGQSIIRGINRAYYGIFKNGVPVEGSRMLNTKSIRGRVRALVDIEEKRFMDIAKGASEKVKKQRKAALDEARIQADKVAKACEDYERLSKKKTLTKKEVALQESAKDVLATYGSPTPVKMGQGMKHLSFTHNPTIFAAYSAGKASRVAAIADHALAQPVMTFFKETVMAPLGFPIRVNIGDEYVRLISEGVLARMGSKIFRRHPLNRLTKELEESGISAENLKDLIHEGDMQWLGESSGAWQLYSKTGQYAHPEYYKYLANDLRSWRSEPIVQRLVAENGGKFPEELGSIEAYLKRIVAEESELGQSLRNFLRDSHGITDLKTEAAAFEQWAALWEDRLTTISRNKTLRDSMARHVTEKELLNGVPDELLWPVNAPESVGKIGLGGPSLNLINYANPFHYIYNGVPVPFGSKIWGNSRKVGSVQLLGVLSNWLRETVFSDRYYIERSLERKRSPHLMDTPEGRLKIHRTATKAAANHTNRVTYSKSQTAAEYMTRNLIPFGNAYRQFWVYWTKAFAQHPVSLTTYMKGYQQGQQSIAGLANQASQSVGGPDIELNDQFLGIGDYQAFLPAIPFLAVQDSEASSGLLGVAESNLPQASFLVTGGARTVMGALGMAPEDYSGLPFMAGLSTKMAPFSRQARLLYGLTGWDMTHGNNTVEGLLGDPEKLKKAHSNAVLGQFAYDPKTDTQNRNKPIWWRAAEDVLGLVGMHDIKPEALFAEGWKTFALSPASASYSPQDIREKSKWTYEYYEALGDGNTEAAAEQRAKHKWLDRYLSYYDATPEERIAMKRDPSNKDILKFWVSPYNYGEDSTELSGSDWQGQFVGGGRRSYKTEKQQMASIHNNYVDIWGGTYVEQRYGNHVVRKEGEEYAGDVSREQGVKNTKKKMEKALRWAKNRSAELAKERGWDPEWLMAKFTDPQRDWSIWPQELKAAGLDPNEYNVDTIAKLFSSNYGGDLESPKSGYRAKAQYLSSADCLRILDMSQWLPDPDMRRRLTEETPFAADIRKTKKEQKTTIIKAVLESAVSEQWYTLGSQQLSLLGVKASPKIDSVLMDLHSDYLAFKKLKAGTAEYKAARTAYYAKRDKQLGRLKGGKLVSGGAAERLIAIPSVLEPDVTLMGTGRNAVNLQKSWNNFDKAIRMELAKKVPNPDHIGMAWEKLVGWKSYSPKQQSEMTRVTAWAFVLASAKNLRRDLMTHHSDYYNAPGESASSKYGQQRIAEFNKWVRRMRTFSPGFAKQSDEWFGKDRNLGNLFGDWYTY